MLLLYRDYSLVCNFLNTVSGVRKNLSLFFTMVYKIVPHQQLGVTFYKNGESLKSNVRP